MNKSKIDHFTDFKKSIEKKKNPKIIRFLIIENRFVSQIKKEKFEDNFFSRINKREYDRYSIFISPRLYRVKKTEIRREPFFFFFFPSAKKFLVSCEKRVVFLVTQRVLELEKKTGEGGVEPRGMSSPRLRAPYPRRNFSVLPSYTLISARFGTREKSCTPRKSTTVYDGRPRPRAWNVTPEGTRPVSASFQIARTPFLRA